MAKLSVGDVGTFKCAGCTEIVTGRVVEAPWRNFDYRLDTHQPCSSGQFDDDELIETTTTNDKETIVSNLVKKVRELALPADEKMLRKHGFVNECGDLTEEGDVVLTDILFSEYRSKLVAKAKELEADEKSDSK